jgi:hypothetical protein
VASTRGAFDLGPFEVGAFFATVHHALDEDFAALEVPI